MLVLCHSKDVESFTYKGVYQYEGINLILREQMFLKMFMKNLKMQFR
jgi:hypothetical protein